MHAKTFWILATCSAMGILSIGCKQGQKAHAVQSEAADTEPPYVMVYMSRSYCYGKCPVYRVEIFTDGTIDYIGEANVPRIGHFRARLSREEVDALRQKIHEVGFWDFAPSYPDDGTIITDLPTTTIQVRIGDMMKKVLDKHGAPRALKEFEVYVERLLENRKWTAVSSDQ